MDFVDVVIVKYLTFLLRKSKIPLFLTIDATIIKLLNLFLENKDFLIWLCNFEWRMIKEVFKILLFISFLFFAYWVIFEILINYLSEAQEEHASENFKNFQKIRQKRWTNFFIMFFLLNPQVLVGEVFFIAPFNHFIISLLDPYFVERKYFLKDGYYDDYLYIYIPIYYEKDLKMVTYFVKLQDSFYMQIYTYVFMFIFSIILIKFYFDWIVFFEMHVYKNIRKTSTFKELVNEYTYWKIKIVKLTVMVFPFLKKIFLYIKKVLDDQELRILSDDEYEEFHTRNLEFYYRKQFFITNFMLIIENYFLALFDRPTKKTF